MNDGILLVPVPSRITDDSLELNQREEQEVSHLMLCVLWPLLVLGKWVAERKLLKRKWKKKELYKFDIL